MLGENTQEYIFKAIAEEMKSGNEKYGLFNSHHEAWAVLKEECEEVADQFTLYKNSRSDAMPRLWEQIKRNSVSWQESEGDLYNIKGAALDLLYECVQVCAMCDKWLYKLEKGSGINADMAAAPYNVPNKQGNN